MNYRDFFDRALSEAFTVHKNAGVPMIEKAIGCPITYVSVGAERESMIVR